MIHRITAALLFVAAVTPALAQAPASAPAAPFTPPTSSLASLLGRYTPRGDFGVKEPKEWGGTTTWVIADGKGTVLVMVRVAPYVRFFTTDGRTHPAVGRQGTVHRRGA